MFFTENLILTIKLTIFVEIKLLRGYTRGSRIVTLIRLDQIKSCLRHDLFGLLFFLNKSTNFRKRGKKDEKIIKGFFSSYDAFSDSYTKGINCKRNNIK